MGERGRIHTEGADRTDQREDPIPISRLSHAGYCLRRAALLTNEQLWQENTDTAKGRIEHERTHTERAEHRGDTISLYEYPVFSDELGINGKCDCVEASKNERGCNIPSVKFPVALFPVEYKHGKMREEEEYKIQLCAQAMCLEEMYSTEITEGAIFYISSHRRQKVVFDQNLRNKVKDMINAIRQFSNDFSIPLPENGPKCKRCSLRELCGPEIPLSSKMYCQRIREEAKGNESL